MIIQPLRHRLFCYTSARRLLSPYLDQELSSELRTRLEEHFRHCSHCSRLYQQLVFATRAVARISVPDQQPAGVPAWLADDLARLPNVRQARLMWRPIIAAAVILIAVTGGFWLNHRYRTLPPVPAVEVVRLSGAPALNARSFQQSELLRKGDRLETDNWSTALLKFGRFGQIEAESGTRLEVLETNAKEQRLSLSRGKIYVSLSAPPRMFFINTAAATAIDLGCAYTLEVNDRQESLLEVVSGWVALNVGEREDLVPAGTSCRARPGKGSGTPFLKDAVPELQDALDRFDFEGAAEALDIVISRARQKDAITLWYLLRKVAAAKRAEIFDRLAQLLPPPRGVTRSGILELNEKMLQAWREPIEYASLGIDPRTVQFDRGALRPVGNLNAMRFGHTATLLDNGKVLVAGGLGQQVLALAEVFDPVTESFSFTGSMMTGRIGHTATLLANGKVLVAGGSEKDAFVGGQATAELYDPASGTFTPTGSMHFPRMSHCATLLKDGKVLISGGLNINRTDDLPAEIYDPATETFRAIARPAYPRFDHTATMLNTGKVLIAGGARVVGDRIEVTGNAEIYDPASQTFHATGSLNIARHKHSAIALPSGPVLIMGGTDITLWNGTMASAEVYDLATGRFAETGKMSTARYKMRDAVVSLANGKILVAGGGERVEIYDPGSGIFTPVSGSIVAARYMSTATLLPNGNVLIIGGYTAPREANGIRVLSDAGAWIYTPAPDN